MMVDDSNMKGIIIYNIMFAPYVKNIKAKLSSTIMHDLVSIGGLIALFKFTSLALNLFHRLTFEGELES